MQFKDGGYCSLTLLMRASSHGRPSLLRRKGKQERELRIKGVISQSLVGCSVCCTGRGICMKYLKYVYLMRSTSKLKMHLMLNPQWFQQSYKTWGPTMTAPCVHLRMSQSKPCGKQQIQILKRQRSHITSTQSYMCRVTHFSKHV